VEDSDDELFARAGRGDRSAFSSLVARHEARLMSAAMRMMSGRAAAEDAVQETLVRAWVQAPRWRPQTNGRAGVGAWLSRVLVNIAIDGARRPRIAPLDAAGDPVDPAIAADEGLISGERRARLHAAIMALPERQRMAVSLSYDAGLSNAQGALAMVTSVGAFELLLVRARRTLRRVLIEGEAI